MYLYKMIIVFVFISNEAEARKSSEKVTVAKSVDDSDITAILAKIHG